MIGTTDWQAFSGYQGHGRVGFRVERPGLSIVQAIFPTQVCIDVIL